MMSLDILEDLVVGGFVIGLNPSSSLWEVGPTVSKVNQGFLMFVVLLGGI
jgi:hypothetical protein